ncbi:FliM/FliN family flagellar motor switch protein [Rhodanobacter sp. KK11]|uniref:FliM/FliN family flagellar motor switch protein n=1 Tax=Rhodanobacter sp. KK11 TaxID=3083255 RepID=UPI00296633FD|nr:FliM/FliN family flagellar motor switch protein [Rhodanobacter sp. KK11]MDW2981764.1 hypothetical protein [Rhodanobacter sp. KK11]
MQAWLADWQVAHDGAAPPVEGAPIVSPPLGDACVLQAGVDHACLMVAIVRNDLARFGNWLADIRGSTATLSCDVGRAALEDLTQRMGQLAGSGTVAQYGADAWPRDLTREELGAVGAVFEVGGVAVNLALSRDAVDAVCPSTPSPTGRSLQLRADAAGTASVRLTAGLDFGSISMRELADLRVGEVLVGECPLETPIRVSAPGSAPVWNARMGRIGNRLAIALVQPSSQQENV